MTLGEKVKYFRLKNNLTQKELAGKFITRNMLSRIENNDASPSLETILYLSEKLNIGTGELVSDSVSAIDIEMKILLQELKELFSKKKYSKCIEKFHSMQKNAYLTDEIALILAECCLNVGIEKYKSGAMRDANNLFSESLGYCKNTLYGAQGIKKTAQLYLNLINFYFGKYAGDFIDFFDDSYSGDDSINEILYVYCNKLIESGDTDYAEQIAELPIFSDEDYALHIYAKCEIYRGNYSQAYELLTKLILNKESTHSTHLLYGVYTDLEICAKCTEDYKNAYKYASLKNDLYVKLFMGKDSK